MRRGALALVVATGLSCACSMIVPGHEDPVHCIAEGAIGAPACGARQICAAGVCTRCVASEVCGDGIDNDCNGVIDDGCTDAGAHAVGAPCCTSAECGGAAVCAFSAGAPVCRTATPGPGISGAPCASDADCRSAHCLAVDLATRVCADACCRDVDCGDPARLACRQVSESGMLVSRCVPL